MGTEERRGLRRLQADLPSQQTLFFLFNQGMMAERALRPEAVDQDRYQYTVINAGQGAMRNIDGRVRSVHIEDPTWFPADYEGGPFRELVAAVAALGGP